MGVGLPLYRLKTVVFLDSQASSQKTYCGPLGLTGVPHIVALGPKYRLHGCYESFEPKPKALSRYTDP